MDDEKLAPLVGATRLPDARDPLTSEIEAEPSDTDWLLKPGRTAASMCIPGWWTTRRRALQGNEPDMAGCVNVRKPLLTADEFERGYAERSGLTVAELREEGHVVRPCHCDYEQCEGWQSTTAERYDKDVAARKRMGMPPP